MKIVRIRNPFPPYPPTPEGVEQRKWISDLEYFRPFVAYVLNSLHDELVETKVPMDRLVSRETLNAQDGMIDLIATAMAKTRVPEDTFWEEVTPERFSSDTILAVFGVSAVNKRATKAIEKAIRDFVSRIRGELAEAGRTGLPVSRSASTPYVTVPDEPRPPRPRKPQKPAKEAMPPRVSIRPPSASAVAAPEDIPDTPAFREDMEEQIAGAAEVIEEEVAAASAPPPVDEDVPPSVRPPSARPPSARPPSAQAASPRPAPKRRPPSAADQIPRIRRLSEATLRAEREYFYSDRDGTLTDRPCPMERRLEGFWEYRAGMRPPDYSALDVAHRQHLNDILLMVIPPGNLVQVYAKGVLTEVFASSREENALNIAARYANQWRGVLPDGTIAPDARRSRLTTRIYAAYYTRKGISQPVLIGEPITEVLVRDPGARGRKLANPAPLSRYLPVSSTTRPAPPAPRQEAGSGQVVVRIRNPRTR